MVDAIVVGAGPAGSMAALVLARGGARVLIVDRATFPRDTLCGDRLSPSSLGLLNDHGLDPRSALPAAAVALRGWRVAAPYAAPHLMPSRNPSTLAIRRCTFDRWLLETAVRAGARFESGWHVRQPLFDESTGLVRGVAMRRRDSAARVRLPALMVIAADGRRSVLARRLHLHVAARVRQRAAGMYVKAAGDFGATGEIHLTTAAYLQVTPVGAGEANVLAVCRDRDGRETRRLLESFVSNHPGLEPVLAPPRPVRVSGLLGAGVSAAGVAGLLLAGDAAGCADPIAGDGVYRAMLGGQLAAEEALDSIASGDFAGAVGRLDAARLARPPRPVPAHQWCLPWGVRAAGVAGCLSPRLLDRVVRRMTGID